MWEGLKRAIRNKEARLEDPAEAQGFLVPHGLRPQPIPLDVKVVITGNPSLYQALSQGDEDFWEIFKVKADFDFQIDRTPEHLQAYAAFACACYNSEGILDFERSAVAKLTEYGARLVGDQQRLSSRLGQVKDLIMEADYWARQAGSPLVTGEHVEQALEEKLYRADLVKERIQRLIADGTIMVDVDGAVAGQVNGLAVIDLGDFAFGRPSRITAKTFAAPHGG